MSDDFPCCSPPKRRTLDEKMAFLDLLPVGTRVTAHTGSRWRKRQDGQWDILSDPAWGPVSTGDLPFYVVLESGLDVAAELMAERDRARATAVRLEQELAAVEAERDELRARLGLDSHLRMPCE